MERRYGCKNELCFFEKTIKYYAQKKIWVRVRVRLYVCMCWASSSVSPPTPPPPPTFQNASPPMKRNRKPGTSLKQKHRSTASIQDKRQVMRVEWRQQPKDGRFLLQLKVILLPTFFASEVLRSTDHFKPLFANTIECIIR